MAAIIDNPPVQAPHYKLTVEDYHRMGEVGILGDEVRIELIEGELIEMAPIGCFHAGLTSRISDWLMPRLSGQAIQGHENWVASVAFSPNGARIVSGSADQTLRLWDVFEGWAVALCKKLGRNMSRREWREWVAPDIGYAEACPGLPIPLDPTEAEVGNR